MARRQVFLACLPSRIRCSRVTPINPIKKTQTVIKKKTGLPRAHASKTGKIIGSACVECIYREYRERQTNFGTLIKINCTPGHRVFSSSFPCSCRCISQRMGKCFSCSAIRPQPRPVRSVDFNNFCTFRKRAKLIAGSLLKLATSSVWGQQRLETYRMLANCQENLKPNTENQ